MRFADREFTEEAAAFSVTFHQRNRDVCAADRCSAAATVVATLAYCYCAEQPGEHGHPGHPEADRDVAYVCDYHGALISHFWESFERLQARTT